MTNWQPIETAPRDGTEIIGCFFRRYDGFTEPTVYGPWTVKFDGFKWVTSWNDYQVIDYESDFGTVYKEMEMTPTHWMPLPNPPTDEATK